MVRISEDVIEPGMLRSGIDRYCMFSLHWQKLAPCKHLQCYRPNIVLLLLFPLLLPAGY